MATTWDYGQVVKALWRWLDRAEQAQGAVAQYRHEGLHFGVPTVLRAGETLQHARFPDITVPIAGLFPVLRTSGQR
jgi:hypothetical protein